MLLSISLIVERRLLFLSLFYVVLSNLILNSTEVLLNTLQLVLEIIIYETVKFLFQMLGLFLPLFNYLDWLLLSIWTNVIWLICVDLLGCLQLTSNLNFSLLNLFDFFNFWWLSPTSFYSYWRTLWWGIRSCATRFFCLCYVKFRALRLLLLDVLWTFILELNISWINDRHFPNFGLFVAINLFRVEF